jgi:glycine/D-amino acid oxidase-like deaminating enzyme
VSAVQQRTGADGRSFDAVITGAGVIGAAIAYELAKRGYRTLNLDKLPAAGYGSTSNSCSIVRARYSSRDGVRRVLLLAELVQLSRCGR